MSYSEIYCDAATGNNMNGGFPVGGVYPITYTNGNWSSVTGIFIPVAANPTTDGVSVDDLASVFVDGATTPAFVGRVTARDAVSLTISLTRKINTIPTTGAAGLTCKVGGYLKGPNGAVKWPVNTAAAALADASGNPVRVNYIGTFNITVSQTTALANVTHQGCTATPGDGGKATIDGSTNAIALWATTTINSIVADFIFSNNGTTGSVTGVAITGQGSMAIRCVAHDIRGIGFSGAVGSFVECEAYNCNTSNTANLGGFNIVNSHAVIRCISHDNTGSNAHGFVMTGAATGIGLFQNCIADTNGGIGFKNASNSALMHLIGCDIYNNTSHGIDTSTNTGSSFYAESCNLINNGGSAVNTHATSLATGILSKCAYGAGTEANGAANAGLGIQEINCITYAADVTPWVDPANGDFRINLTAAKGTGYGLFTQTAASYAGAIGYPDIGSNQHQDAGGAANSGNLFSSPIVRAI